MLLFFKNSSLTTGLIYFKRGYCIFFFLFLFVIEAAFLSPKAHAQCGAGLNFSPGQLRCPGDTQLITNNSPSDDFGFKWNIIPANLVDILDTDTSRNIRVVFKADTCYTITLAGSRTVMGVACSRIDTVHSCFMLPHPDFYVSAPSLYCAPALETFINATTNKGSTIGYIWDFGDGSSLYVSDTSQVSHVYDHFNTSQIKISLTALTQHGCSQTITKTAINIVGPVPKFTMDQRTGCDSLTVHFTNISKNVKKFYFLDGDGSPPDSVSLPPHKYVLSDPNLDSIYFYPTLLSIGDSLCSDNFKDTIKIYRHCTNGINPVDNSQFSFSVYPNPFQSSITVQYDLTKTSRITLSLFDITGRQIGTIINENKVPGAYQFDINAEKYKLSPGIYVLKFMAGDNAISRQMVKF